MNKSLMQLERSARQRSARADDGDVREFGTRAARRKRRGGAHVRKAHAAYFLVLAEEAAAGAGRSRPADLARAARSRSRQRPRRAGMASHDRQRLVGAAAGDGAVAVLGDQGALRGRPALAVADAGAAGGLGRRSPARAKAVFAARRWPRPARLSAEPGAISTEALRIYRELGDRPGLAIVTQRMAVGHKDDGEAASARELLEEAGRCGSEIGDVPMRARTLSNLATMPGTGRDRRRAARYQEALGVFQQLGDA